MPALLRSRLTIFALVAALGAALPACGTDDAIQRDTKDAGQKLDKGAGNVDEKAGEAAEDAGNKIEQGAEDVDGN
jgi:predicted small secreted protein